jgi:Tfp pilus assembly protein PilF
MINPSPKYAFAIAQLLDLKKDHSGAEKTLNMIMKRWPHYSLAYFMQAEMYARRGLTDQAKNVLKKGMEIQGISVRDKLRLSDKLQALGESKN